MASVAYQSYLKHSKGEVVKLFPSEPKRDFVYIKDVLNANYLALLTYNENRGNFFDVGTGNARKFEDVLNIIGVPYKYTSINEIPSGYQFNTKSSKNKFLKGWKPYYSLEEGLDTYVRELSSFSNNKYIQSSL